MSCWSHYFKRTAGRREWAVMRVSVWIKWYADDSFKILLVAFDPCWAMQHLGLTDSRTGTAKPNMECFLFFLMTVDAKSNQGHSSTEHIWCLLVVSVRPYLSILDNLFSCVHLEEITPTLPQISVGFLMGRGGVGDLRCSEICVVEK